MKALLLPLLLLLPSLASAAPAPLECEPNAKVTFVSRWMRQSLVRLEGQLHWELPWTGREALVSGKQLRADRLREMASTEAAAADELLLSVPEETSFVAFKRADNGQNPLQSLLLVDRDLLKGGEGDGLVIAVQQRQLELTGQPESVVKVFHCRSR